MANIICKKNNLTPKFMRYKSVPEVLAAVESEECHMAFSGITITADREKRVDFSQPFFDSGLSIAVRTEPSSGFAGTYRVVGDMFDKQRYGIVFPQNSNDRYKELFNIAIIEMQRSGEYQKIYNK